jgi:hypothetical protein
MPPACLAAAAREHAQAVLVLADRWRDRRLCPAGRAVVAPPAVLVPPGVVGADDRREITDQDGPSEVTQQSDVRQRQLVSRADRIDFGFERAALFRERSKQRGRPESPDQREHVGRRREQVGRQLPAVEQRDAGVKVAGVLIKVRDWRRTHTDRGGGRVDLGMHAGNRRQVFSEVGTHLSQP